MKITFLVLAILILTGCAKSQQLPQQESMLQKSVPIIPSEDVAVLTPEQVVLLYFQAWNDEQYDVMYSLVSDGFKQIDPTAKKLEDFKLSMEKFYDTALGVRVVEAKESYRNEKEAGVNYKIEITNNDNSKKEFSSSYTLKKRQNGWKLIHPYGKNIDTSE